MKWPQKAGVLFSLAALSRMLSVNMGAGKFRTLSARVFWCPGCPSVSSGGLGKLSSCGQCLETSVAANEFAATCGQDKCWQFTQPAGGLVINFWIPERSWEFRTQLCEEFTQLCVCFSPTHIHTYTHSVCWATNYIFHQSNCSVKMQISLYQPTPRNLQLMFNIN